MYCLKLPLILSLLIIIVQVIICKNNSVAASSTNLQIKNNSLASEGQFLDSSHFNRGCKQKYEQDDDDVDKKKDGKKKKDADDDSRKANEKVIGGRRVDIQKYPWSVSLSVNFGRTKPHFCMGAFIHESWVLTAGHCTHAASVSQARGRTVALYGHHLRGRGEGVRLKTAFIHPQWHSPDHDIGLFELEYPVQFGNRINKLLLWTKKDTPTENLKTASWGSTNFREQIAYHLLELDPVVSVNCDWLNWNGKKRQRFKGGQVNKISEQKGKNSTAAYIRGFKMCLLMRNKGFWKGDSGGSIVYLRDDKTGYAVAVTSMAPDSSGFGRFPSWHTLVAPHVSWIKEITNINTTDPLTTPKPPQKSKNL